MKQLMHGIALLLSIQRKARSFILWNVEWDTSRKIFLPLLGVLSLQNWRELLEGSRHWLRCRLAMSSFSTATSRFRVGQIEQTEVFWATPPSVGMHACRMDSSRGDPFRKYREGVKEGDPDEYRTVARASASKAAKATSSSRLRAQQRNRLSAAEEDAGFCVSLSTSLSCIYALGHVRWAVIFQLPNNKKWEN